MAHRKKRNTPRFFQLSHTIYDSDEFKSLSLAAESIFFSLLRQYNGFNNGNLYASQRSFIGRKGLRSPKRIIAAIEELVECGLIVVTYPGSPNKSRRVALRFHEAGKLPAFIPIRSWELWRPGMKVKHEKCPVRYGRWE